MATHHACVTCVAHLQHGRQRAVNLVRVIAAVGVKRTGGALRLVVAVALGVPQSAQRHARVRRHHMPWAHDAVEAHDAALADKGVCADLDAVADHRAVHNRSCVHTVATGAPLWLQVHHSGYRCAPAPMVTPPMMKLLVMRALLPM
jgi:hypothetical protein